MPKSSAHSLHMAYMPETQPLFPHTGRKQASPSAYSAASGLPLQQDESAALSPSQLQRQTLATTFHSAALLVTNGGFFVLGGAGMGFLLFYLTFFEAVWPSMLGCGLALCGLLIVHGAYGIFAQCWHRVAPMGWYVASTAVLVGAVAGVEAIFFVAWTASSDVSSRYSLSQGLGATWLHNVMSEGTSMDQLCSVERELHCSGWAPGCWTSEESARSVPEAVRWQRNKVLMDLSLRLTEAAGGSDLESDGSYNWANMTQGGSCPMCLGASSFDGLAPQTCADAIHETLDAAVWYVLGVGVAVGVGLVLNVLWTKQTQRRREVDQASLELLDAQRYL